MNFWGVFDKVWTKIGGLDSTKFLRMKVVFRKKPR